MAADIIPLKKASAKRATNARAQARAHLQSAIDTGVRGALRDAILTALDLANGHKRKELTHLAYEALKPGQRLVDPHRPGFIAKASRNGVRLIYRHNDPVSGVRTETLIGYLGAVSLAEARERWAEMRARRLSGEKPLQESESPVASIPTVHELVDVYLADYCEKVKRSWKDDQRLLHRHLIPGYGDLPATQLSADAVADLLAGLGHTPREAEKLRASMMTMFNVAVGRTKKIALRETWLPRDHPNPVANVTVVAHKAARHNPHESAIRQYAAALHGDTLRRDVADVLLLQLLTASRVGEVVGAAWSEFDLDHGKWHLPGERMKNGDAHTVILSDRALALVERRKDIAVGPWVFARPTNSKQHLRAEVVQNAVAEHREELGVAPGFSSHAVRRAFMSWAGSNGYAVEIRNRCTAHRMTTGIDGIYTQPELDGPARQLWQAWSEWLGG